MSLLADRAFLRALHHETKKSHVVHAADKLAGDDDPDWELGTNMEGFCTATKRELGKLWGMLFVQAQTDGATSIRLHYDADRMIYRINDTDYDMVAPPPPLNTDMCKLLAIAAKTRWGAPGTLPISFADLSIELKVRHGECDSKPAFLEIIGFTGQHRPGSAVYEQAADNAKMP
jgi:hypothetical protein